MDCINTAYRVFTIIEPELRISQISLPVNRYFQYRDNFVHSLSMLSVLARISGFRLLSSLDGKVQYYVYCMGRASTVETHPQFDLITDLLFDRQPDEIIAKSVVPELSPSAIRRYRLKSGLTGARPISPPESMSRVDKLWVQSGYVGIYQTAMRDPKCPDLPSARAALDSLSRLNGYDAPKRSESLTLNVHALGSAQLQTQLAHALQAIPEHERKALLADSAIDILPE